MVSTTNPGDYIKLGWKVFPCHNIVDGHCSCRDGWNCNNPGKHPRTRNGFKDATDNIEQLRVWWEMFPDTNWALATGKMSGVVVIDIDARKGGFDSYDELVQRRGDEMPDTLRAATGGGGKHLIYAYPDDASIGSKVGWVDGIDIRADGGYIILPPGTHISGGVYDWINWGTPLVLLPDDVTRGLSAAGGGSGGLSAEELGSTDQLLGGIREGSRDNDIFRAACRLRRQLGDDAKAAVTLLVLEMARQASPPFPERDALVKIEQAFKQDHSDLDIMIFGGDADDGSGAVTQDDPIFEMTDMGNRDRFVRAYGDDWRYVDGLGWLQWGDLGWQPTNELIVSDAVQKVPAIIREDAKRVADVNNRARLLRWSRDTQSSGRIQSIIKLTSTSPIIHRSAEEFDADPHLLAARNGMIDLRDGSLRAFTRDDLFTKNTRVLYDPQFVLEPFERFLESATDGDKDLQEYLQMAAGYTLTGLVNEECFFLVSGPTASGKSTFTTGLETAMGSYADIVNAETFMFRFGKDAPREELVKFAGARLISVEEMPEGGRFDDALMKKITGGSTLTARKLYQESYSFLPQFAMWFATNHDPSTQDQAMMRRMKRVPFPITIPEGRRDPALKALMKDRDLGGKAVLAWAVRGAIKYLQAGKLETPWVVRTATDSYAVRQDMFLTCLNDSFVFKAEHSMKITDAYKTYNEWCKENNEHPMKRNRFIDRLSATDGLVIQKNDHGQDVVLGLSQRAFVPFAS